MAANTTTTATTADLVDAARTAYAATKRAKGQRPLAVQAFLAAESNEERDMAIEAWGAGFVRRGLREAAVFMKDEEVANAFWTLRDAVTDDGFIDFDNEDAEVAA
jgi:hypothetical protein